MQRRPVTYGGTGLPSPQPGASFRVVVPVGRLPGTSARDLSLSMGADPADEYAGEEGSSGCCPGHWALRAIAGVGVERGEPDEHQRPDDDRDEDGVDRAAALGAQ
jgi:hypothetical protein